MLTVGCALWASMLVTGSALSIDTTADGEVIDEVYALVDRTPILKSDIDMLQLVGLAGEMTEGESPEDFLSRTLDLRIRLELQYRDLVVSGSIHRLTIDVGEELSALIARGDGRENVETKLAENGLSWDDLEALALRTSATRAWVDQHLRPRISVTIEDIENAYKELVVESHLHQGEEPPPLARVQDDLRLIIVERNINREIDRWLVQARDRLEVLRFHP